MKTKVHPVFGGLFSLAAGIMPEFVSYASMLQMLQLQMYTAVIQALSITVGFLVGVISLINSLKRLRSKTTKEL